MNNERPNAPANDDYQLARDQASVLAGALMSFEKAIKFLMETDLLAIIARAPRADSDMTITLAKPHYDALLARSEAADSERDRLREENEELRSACESYEAARIKAYESGDEVWLNQEMKLIRARLHAKGDAK